MDLVGPLNAVLSAIGDELSDFGGFRVTRLSADAADGATTINVESTTDWPAAGKVFLDKTLYSYSSKTVSTLVGLSPPLVGAHPKLTQLADAARVYSALDLVRNMIFVDTSEGVYLDNLGNNYGVPRPDGLSDVAYRKLIKAIAFSPKGTVYALELALTAIVGAGNFEVFEDLVNNPNEVFIRLTTNDDSPAHKSYFDVDENKASASTTTVVATNAPLGGERNSVRSVTLADDFAEVTGDVKPSAEPVAWTYTGTTAEGTAVTVNGDGSVNFVDSVATVGVQYTRNMRMLAETEVVVEATIRVNSLGSTPGLLTFFEANSRVAIKLDDGTKNIIVCVANLVPDFIVIDNSGNALLTVPLAIGAVHKFKIHKHGGLLDGYPVNGDPAIDFYIDDVLVGSLAYGDLPASSGDHRVTIGSLSAKGTSDSDWFDVRVSTEDRTELWNMREVEAAAVATADPGGVTVASAPFIGSDAACEMALRNGAAAHGRNNGRYEISTRDAANHVTVTGIEYSGAVVTGPDKLVITDDNFDLFTAEDAGVQAQLQTGTAGNGILWKARYGGGDGNAITVKITAVAAHPSMQVLVVGAAIEVKPRTNAGSTILSTAREVIAAVQASAQASALVDVSRVSTGLGAVVATGPTNLAGGEDGKFLSINGSASNDGSRLIATLIDDHTVLLGSHVSPAGLVDDSTAETAFTWQKDPNFIDETGLEYEVIAAGRIITPPTLTLRRTLYTSPLLLALHYSVISSGQVEGGIDVVGTESVRRPLYLLDSLAFVQGILDGLTVAGVFARTSR